MMEGSVAAVAAEAFKLLVTCDPNKAVRATALLQAAMDSDNLEEESAIPVPMFELMMELINQVGRHTDTI